MNEKKQLMLFLLTRDSQYLPEGYSEVEINAWLADSNLDRMRAVRRLSVDIIRELKLNEAAALGQSTFDLSTRNWCPPTCI